MKFCKDCKYFVPPEVHRNVALCAKIEGIALDPCFNGFDPVYGMPFYKSCILVRCPSGECGVEAKLFEPDPIGWISKA